MRLRIAVLLVIAAVCSTFAGSLAALQFPRLQDENLNGQQAVLPDSAPGKVAVLVLGFSRASSTPTGAWAKRIQSDFAKTPASSCTSWPCWKRCRGYFAE